MLSNSGTKGEKCLGEAISLDLHGASRLRLHEKQLCVLGASWLNLRAFTVFGETVYFPFNPRKCQLVAQGAIAIKFMLGGNSHQVCRSREKEKEKKEKKEKKAGVLSELRGGFALTVNR